MVNYYYITIDVPIGILICFAQNRNDNNNKKVVKEVLKEN